MENDGKLLKSALDVVRAFDMVADEALPKEIAGVVKLHSKLAVGSALIPVPGADVAAGAAAIWGMYLRINNKLDLKISENVVKTIASGVATNLASYVAMLGIGSALKFIPGIGSIGGALAMGGALYGLTLTSGYVYLRALTAWKKEEGHTDLGKNVDDVLKNSKNEIKNFISEAKSSYKNIKDN